MVDELNTTEVLEYENYIDIDGNLDEKKLENMFNNMIKNLK